MKELTTMINPGLQIGHFEKTLETQGKTQELKKKLRVSAIFVELEVENELSSTRMSSSMLFFARHHKN